MNKSFPLIFTGCFLIFLTFANAQKASIKESKEVFITYPFSDPNPIAQMNTIYPYFRFDGYSIKGEKREWQVVTLENEYIKVIIAPEIGGKVLGAIEKSSGHEFIYFNKVVKFRNIALRGPWTSGGIEFNFGIIGHTPSTATPVDYLLKENDDGSVSCIVGTMDLPSRTEWRVEIRLPKDKAYFETRSFWYNPTIFNTSVYNWTTAAVNAGDGLHLCYDGTNYIDHGGNAYKWPINDKGIDISYYANNNFGSHKSYHVLGEHTNYFGGYYNYNFGFGYYSLYSDKPGKKIWLWSLARDGEIWKDLLTDNDNKQYVEVQTGLLFNQPYGIKTPFKYSFFIPNSEFRFNEFWFPSKGLEGMVAANSYGSINTTQNNNKLKFGFCPNQNINKEFSVLASGKNVYSKHLTLKPMEIFTDSIPLDIKEEFEIKIGNNLLSYNSNEKASRKLNRPIIANNNYGWNSTAGLFSEADLNAKQRFYQASLDKYLESLKKDSLYSPSLVGAAELYLRRMEYDKALKFATIALANDAYDPDANYIYGIVNKRIGNKYDALDGLGFASRSMKYRSAANEQIAEIYFLDGKMELVEEFAHRALDYDKYNINALKLLAITKRVQNNEKSAEDFLNEIAGMDPLNHFAGFEHFLQEPKPEGLRSFSSSIHSELPYETCLELAISYFNLGLNDEAIRALEESPPYPIVFYWLSYLYDKKSEMQKSGLYLEKAIHSSPYLVYPFRQETVEVLKWAETKRGNWKNKYYLALIYWSKDRFDIALEFLKECRNDPDFGPFYLVRGNLYKLFNQKLVLENYKKALELDKNEWRVYHTLTDYYFEHIQYKEALEISKTGATLFPDSYIMRFDYAKSLLYNNEHKSSLNILEELMILPYEGAWEGREIYRQACIMFGLEHYKKHKYQEAIKFLEKAKLWPENLGVGKPYDVDIRLENYLQALCHQKISEKNRYDDLIKEIVDYTISNPDNYSTNRFIGSLVLREAGMSDKAKISIEDWINKYPTSIIALWSSYILNDETEKAKEIIKKMKIELKKSPWILPETDFNFKVLLEIL